MNQIVFNKQGDAVGNRTIGSCPSKIHERAIRFYSFENRNENTTMKQSRR